jgi:hypothetical protein
MSAGEKTHWHLRSWQKSHAREAIRRGLSFDGPSVAGEVVPSESVMVVG